MIKVSKLTEYTPEVAAAMRGLLIELSRSGKDRGEIPKEWFIEVVNSPWHEVLLAYDNGRIIGMMSLSVVMGAGVRKNAYIEDFVVTEAARGTGAGGALWRAMEDWARAHGCKRIELTCGKGREAAQAFYMKHGVEIYQTNFFRKELNAGEASEIVA